MEPLVFILIFATIIYIVQLTYSTVNERKTRRRLEDMVLKHIKDHFNELNRIVEAQHKSQEPPNEPK